MKRTLTGALLALSLCSPGDARAEPDTEAQAKKLFLKANRKFKKKKFDVAIEMYLEAARLAPRVGAIHTNVARAYARTDRCGLALLHLNAYLFLRPSARDREGIYAERQPCLEQIGEPSLLSVNVHHPSDRPPDAESVVFTVSIGGVVVGETPLAGVTLAPGKYEVELTAGDRERVHVIELAARENHALLVADDGGVAPGMLVFDVQPPGAELHVDGAKIGAAPYQGLVPFARGEHEVRVVDPADRFEPWSATIALVPGQEETVRVALKPRPAMVIVRAPAGAAITLAGEPIAAGEARSLPPGRYEATATQPDHFPWTGQIEVGPAEQRELEAELKPIPSDDSWMWWAGGGAGALGVAALVLFM